MVFRNFNFGKEINIKIKFVKTIEKP